MILAFGHQSRVGKNLAGQYAVELFQEKGFNATAFGIADALKEYTRALFEHHGVQETVYYEKVPAARELVLPTLGMTVVELWVKTGQAMRAVHEDVWIDLAIQFASEMARKHTISVITDLRFPNEGKQVLDAGGRIYKITRAGQKLQGSDSAMPADFPWTGTLANDGTREELRSAVDAAVTASLQAWGWEGDRADSR